MSHPTEISRAQAQLLMSQLIDGELSPRDADRLHAFLEAHPEEADWMEGLDAARQSPAADSKRNASLAAIRDGVSAPQPIASTAPRKIIRFPSFFRPLAAAAAVVAVGTLTWLGVRPSPNHTFEPSVVEFVATDIPNASTFVHSDEESGWTVVWVESDSAPQS